jgi:hypothetical protein
MSTMTNTKFHGTNLKILIRRSKRRWKNIEMVYGHRVCACRHGVVYTGSS